MSTNKSENIVMLYDVNDESLGGLKFNKQTNLAEKVWWISSNTFKQWIDFGDYV